MCKSSIYAYLSCLKAWTKGSSLIIGSVSVSGGSTLITNWKQNITGILNNCNLQIWALQSQKCTKLLNLYIGVFLVMCWMHACWKHMCAFHPKKIPIRQFLSLECVSSRVHYHNRVLVLKNVICEKRARLPFSRGRMLLYQLPGLSSNQVQPLIGCWHNSSHSFVEDDIQPGNKNIDVSVGHRTNQAASKNVQFFIWHGSQNLCQTKEKPL